MENGSPNLFLSEKKIENNLGYSGLIFVFESP